MESLFVSANVAEGLFYLKLVHSKLESLISYCRHDMDARRAGAEKVCYNLADVCTGVEGSLNACSSKTWCHLNSQGDVMKVRTFMIPNVSSVASSLATTPLTTCLITHHSFLFLSYSFPKSGQEFTYK